MSSNLDLNKYLSGDNSEYVDNTNKLRKSKHSSSIRKNINDIEKIRAETGELYKTDIVSFKNKCIQQNPFLYNNYFEIFNRVAKKEMNLQIMGEFLNVLTRIEEGELDIEEVEKRLVQDRHYTSTNRWVPTKEIKNGYVVNSRHTTLISDAHALDMIVF